MLPHQFPFRLVERLADGSVWVITTASMWAARGREELPFSLALEMLAQGAHEVLSAPGSTEAVDLRLAGIDEGELFAPIEPGARLRVEAEMLGRFGPLVKATARLVDGETVVAKANLLLASG
jgi:3-hydroxymyristoyl/3-hydroxydecanoyl-(acyl carrier protein) dehydratase